MSPFYAEGDRKLAKKKGVSFQYNGEVEGGRLVAFLSNAIRRYGASPMKRHCLSCANEILHSGLSVLF